MAAAAQREPVFDAWCSVVHGTDFRIFSQPAIRRSLTLAVLGSLATLLAAPPAFAVPANDNLGSAEPIPSLPFADTETDVATGTVESTDPLIVCRSGFAIGQSANSLWYTYTTGAATEYLNLSTATSNYDTALTVYQGSPSPATMITGGCNEDDLAADTSKISGLRLQAATTYRIEVTRFAASATPATLNLSVTTAPRYDVTKTADTSDGVCGADCSLREAITASNTAPGAVVVPAGTYTRTRSGTDDTNVRGDFDVIAGLGLYGAGPAATVIDFNDIDRGISISAGVPKDITVTIADIGLRNGNAPGDGGALLAGSFGASWVDLDRLSIESSIASDEGGGLLTDGAGRLRRSTVTGNQAATAGGGMRAAGGTPTEFEIRDSTIDSNLALGGVGGGGVISGATLTIVNSTINANRAHLNGGGAAFVGPGVAALISTTVSGNVADFDANGTGTGGGISLSTSGLTTIRNSVFADNVDNTAAAPDCSRSAGTLTTSFSHLEATAGGCVFAGTGDATGADPGLAPALAANGGPTLTQRSLAGSPLIDTGDPAGCVDRRNAPLASDQRGSGFARVLDGNDDSTAVCDKGAYERLGGVTTCGSQTATIAEDQPGPIVLSCAHPDGAVYGTASALQGSVTGTGATRTYSAPQNYNGPDTISFSAGAGPGTPTVPGTLDLTVTPVNDTPVAAPDTFAVAAGGSLVVAAPGVLFNDTDVDADVLTADLQSAPSHGGVGLAADGRLSYVPAAGFNGVDTFTYSARDATAASVPVTVTVTVGTGQTPVTPPDEPPASPPVEPPTSPPAAPAVIAPAGDPLPPPATPPVVIPPVQPRDTTVPVISGLGARQSGRALGFTLSEPARVTLKLFQSRPGIKRGTRCVAQPEKRPRGARACTRSVLVKSLGTNGKKGAGTLGVGTLKRGKYVVEAGAVDTAGNRSRAAKRTLNLGR